MVSSYSCREIDLTGTQIETTYRGETKDEIIGLIRSKGHTPVKIQAIEELGQDVKTLDIFQKKVKSKDIAIFCKQLHTMLEAGMPLITALEVLSNQSENSTLKKIIFEVALSVQKGTILSESMRAYPKVFPSLLINMIEAGEMTGNLDNVLEKMADHYDKETKINSSIQGALIYPAVLSILVIVVVIFLLVFVMPTFIGMFTTAGAELPGPTRVVLGVSDALQNYWYIFLAVIGGAVYGIRTASKTLSGKRFLDNIKLKFPLTKGPMKKIVTSRFSRTLSTMLVSGIPIIDALTAAASTTNNQVIIEGVEQINEDIKKGSNLSALLKKMDIFPPMMVSMVSVGEESGALEEMLSKTADYYDEELEAAVSKLVKLLEPLMIIFMALIVGFIVIAMMLPMFDMYSLIA